MKGLFLNIIIIFETLWKVVEIVLPCFFFPIPDFVQYWIARYPQILHEEIEDTMIQAQSNNGYYFAKPKYNLLIGAHTIELNCTIKFSWILKMMILHCIRISIWFILHKSLSTNHLLHNCGIPTSSPYLCYGTNTESLINRLRDFHFSLSLWTCG